MFQIEAEQFGVLRQKTLAKALAETLDGSRYDATIDVRTGDVLATDYKRNTTRFGFDEQGFVGRITSPLGRSWLLENGPRGRLDALTNPAGARVGFQYDQYGKITSLKQDEGDNLDLTYDDQGNLAQIRHPDGSTTGFRYDTANRLVEKVDRLGHREVYGYDAEGNLESITDANGRVTGFEYSEWNRPDRARFPDGRVETYAYDEQGRLARLGDVTGPVAELDYAGEATQATRIAYADGEVLSYRYDDQGRILEAKSPEATATFEYDAEGRLVRETLNDAVVAYHYDASGSLVELVYPGGSKVGFGYDADQRLAAVTDWNAGTTRWRYVEAERGFAIDYPSRLVSANRKTPKGQLDSLDVRMDGKHRQFAIGLDYDREDRVQRLTDSEFGVQAYYYDLESRLVGVEADRPERNERFVYDAAGNRVGVGEQVAEFDPGDKLLRQGETRCTYDAAGRLAVIHAPAGGWRLTWNRRGLLVRAESLSGATTVTFGYDAFGRRIWKRSVPAADAAPRLTQFWWAGEQMIAEVAWEGERIVRRQEYCYLPGSFTPFATRIDGQVYHYHCDNLGTPRRLTDASGEVVWAADYDAFGKARIATEQVTNALRFPGQYCDEETGWHYNRFRYYSAEFGRYLSRDPIGRRGGGNLYLYADNSTPNHSDPLGLFVLLALGVFAALAIVASFMSGVYTESLNRFMDGKAFCFSCAFEAGLKQLGGFFEGIFEGLVGLFTGLWDLAVGIWNLTFRGLYDRAGFEQSWQQFGRALGYLVRNPDALWTAFKEPYVEAWENGEYGKAFGLGLTFVGEFLVGARGATKLGKFNKAGKVGDAPGKSAAVKYGWRGRNTEPGAEPPNQKLLKEMEDATVRSTLPPPEKAGWPEIPSDAAATFRKPPEPIELPEGAKIYRVIGYESNPNGSYWTTTDPRTISEAQWRSGSAVRGEWNGDGAFVEHQVPKGGMKVWSGESAPQMSSDGVNMLRGGDNQIWVPYGSTNPSTPISTGF